MFKKIDSKIDLPKSEEEVLKFWDENKIFEKSLEIRKDAPLYSFYDGPPFATGTPHYGHIVASTMKDTIPRYWTMKGYRVPRKWGWDCHGLPIENIAEKELGFKHKKDIEEYGIDKFNDVCRSKVLEYVSEWEVVMRRLGRWADMKNAYKTMDLSFMESVWWVFKQLWDKGLVYESYRAMHICPRCETTLSQSEVTEGYKMVKDLSTTVKFELIDEPNTFVLAWTTTPWTLIGNVALAVGNNIDYVKVSTARHSEANAEESQRSFAGVTGLFKSQEDKRGAQDDIYYILAKDRTGEILKDQGYKIVEEFKGDKLIGKKYKPLFDYYSKSDKLENKENGCKIYSADFVTTEEGTGVVHIAPAFGEDDMNLGKEKNLPFVQHIGMDGIIKSECDEFAGMHVKPMDDVQKTDVEIIKYLAGKNLLFAKEQYEHSYPHCWRCETPLLNYATSSWFVSITKIKDEAIELAKDINWTPKHIKNGRFGKWLEGARDWSISRQRFWASVIPLWKCDKCGEMKVFGSVSELETASGTKVDDIHKHIVDKVTFGCDKCDGTMKRIPDVIDTWFDSGSMPYAQKHYPFENKEEFDKSFPAEFIAEGVDQTRAWFYYLHSIATAIFQKPAYKNVVVNGIVLAEDGKKMSKRLQNYPDPAELFHKYGADPLRLYLLTSPVMSAENLNFKEADVADLYRGMFRMLWNSYSFFILYANIDNWSPPNNQQPTSNNCLDRWMISELNTLILEMNESMKKYELVKASRLIAPFIDNLSNWYIRRSRKRFWKSENDGDKENAYQTLYTVLVELSKLMAPFTPFIAEEIYKNLTGKESVHLEKYPEANKELIDSELNEEMILVRKLVEAGLSLRAENKIKVRQSLSSLKYFGKKLDKDLEEIIAEEVNVKEVVKSEEKNDNLAELDTNITPELKQEGSARELIRNIQSLRKNSGFQVEDRIQVSYSTESKLMSDMIEKQKDIIAKEVLANNIKSEKSDSAEGKEEFAIDGEKIWIGINRTK